MAYPFKKPTTSILSVISISILLAFSGCKKEPRTFDEPTPRVLSVLISAKNYPVVTISNQLWTTENYSGPGGLPYKGENNKPEYGRYYTFEETKAIVVPDGWRISTLQDYKTLAESQGIVFTNNRASGQEAIKKLVSTTNWRTTAGTNASGFNAQPAGYSYQNSQPMDGDISEFWLADGNTVSLQESASGKAHTMLFYGSNGAGYRFTIRFVRNQ